MKLNLKWQRSAAQTLLKKVWESFLCSCAGGGADREEVVVVRGGGGGTVRVAWSQTPTGASSLNQQKQRSPMPDLAHSSQSCVC